jgi:hypothetical protein
VFNKPVGKDVFEETLKNFDLGSTEGVARALTQFKKFVVTIPHVYAWLQNCENVTGNNVRNSRNCHYCFDGTDLEDCRYCTWIFNCNDVMDCYGMGVSERVYDCVGVEEVQQIAFSLGTSNSVDCYYTDLCFNCKHLFCCVGLRNKSYCIFNKQYSKEAYEMHLKKLIEQMRLAGEWGEFFPSMVSAFAYNESKAQEDYPLSKAEAISKAFQWKDDIDEVPQVEKIIPAKLLPDSIQEIPDDVLNWAINCEETNRPYRIVKKELDFYRTKQWPVPHVHPDVRRRKRVEARNPRNLWSRSCGKCGKDIQTTYSPERPEIVHCESCYLKEIY